MPLELCRSLVPATSISIARRLVADVERKQRFAGIRAWAAMVRCWQSDAPAALARKASASRIIGTCISTPSYRSGAGFSAPAGHPDTWQHWPPAHPDPAPRRCHRGRTGSGPVSAAPHHRPPPILVAAPRAMRRERQSVRAALRCSTVPTVRLRKKRACWRVAWRASSSS